ncbi:MAG: SCP2 sterol-binding domain-containing protein [Promethearchaeota archaeon]
MVDENLLNDLKKMREEGPSGPSDVLKLFELAKQLSQESEDMKEELEDMDEMTVQFIMNDVDYKWWVKLGEGKFEYGEGEASEPSVTLSTTQENWANMFGGEADATSLYMSGDLLIEGNLQDAIAFGEILSMIQDEFEE